MTWVTVVLAATGVLALVAIALGGRGRARGELLWVLFWDGQPVAVVDECDARRYLEEHSHRGDPLVLVRMAPFEFGVLPDHPGPRGW